MNGSKTEIDEAFKDYLDLMHELAIRTELVQQALEGRLKMSPAYAYEYGYFQFRRICELLAIGCLQLYGDASALKNSLKREWNAARLMQALHEKYPRAFPEPAIVDATNAVSRVSETIQDKVLSRADFHTLYAKCNDVLHRGACKFFREKGRITASDIKSVAMWCNKIVNLLNGHVVARADKKKYYFIQMKKADGLPRGIIYTINNNGTVEAQEVSRTL